MLGTQKPSVCTAILLSWQHGQCMHQSTNLPCQLVCTTPTHQSRWGKERCRCTRRCWYGQWQWIWLQGGSRFNIRKAPPIPLCALVGSAGDLRVEQGHLRSLAPVLRKVVASATVRKWAHSVPSSGHNHKPEKVFLDT